MNPRRYCESHKIKKESKKEKDTVTKYLIYVEKESQVMQFDNSKTAFEAGLGNEDAIDEGRCAEKDFSNYLLDECREDTVIKVTITKKVLKEPEGYKKCPCGHGYIKK
jgi:hypothetical protein